MPIGYWGDRTWVGGEFAARLAGAPADVINPNELGFLIVFSSILTYYLLVRHRSFLVKLIGLGILAAGAYALVLTASRSALVVYLIGGFYIIWTSKYRVILMSLAAVGLIGVVGSLSDFHRDRYLSIIDSNTKSSATAQGRYMGWGRELETGIDRPIFGHGVGTSKEAMFNKFGGKATMSHNLYLEVFMELGFVGLIFFLVFLKSIIKNLMRVRTRFKEAGDETGFVPRLAAGVFLWALVTLVFSFAQYGLSRYNIYFIAALAVILSTGFDEQDDGKQENGKRAGRPVLDKGGT